MTTHELVGLIESLPPPSEPPPPPIIEKLPPRPAPTSAYSYKEYNQNIKVIYVRNSEEANKVLTLHPPNGPLGFDVEWRPKFSKGGKDNPVSLIQLANENIIMLFQVSAMNSFPSKLVDVLADMAIVKAGVAIQGDAKKLFTDHKVPIRNCVDLTLLARTVDNARWAGKYNSPIGLAHMIQSYEYRLLLKGKTSCSNWAAVLDAKQQEYACNDAHAGYVLYKKLVAMIPDMPSRPDPTWYSFSIFNGDLCNDHGFAWEANNPNYDPGPLPPLKGERTPIEAGLAGKEKPEQKLEEPGKLKQASSRPSHQGKLTTAVQPQPSPQAVHSRVSGTSPVVASTGQKPAPTRTNPRTIPVPLPQRPSPARRNNIVNHHHMPTTSFTRADHGPRHQATGSRRSNGRGRKDATVPLMNSTLSRNNQSNGLRPVQSHSAGVTVAPSSTTTVPGSIP